MTTPDLESEALKIATETCNFTLTHGAEPRATNRVSIYDNATAAILALVSREVEREREACALVAYSFRQQYRMVGGRGGQVEASGLIESSIRARGGKA